MANSHFPKFGQYSLTRPITKSGNAFYWTALVNIAHGEAKNAQDARNRDFKYFTYQALREAGLIETIKGYYEITDKGMEYIRYYDANSNPTISFFEHYDNTTIKAIKCKNQPSQEVIDSIYRAGELHDLAENQSDIDIEATLAALPVSTLAAIKDITATVYVVNVERTNGANIYVERYTFDNQSDATIAKEIMNKANNTKAVLV